MKDEPRKPLEALGDEALEARIVAWVLGEASAFEAAELEERCESDGDLRRFADRMREVHQLIEADGRPLEGDGWKLPDGKRRKVVDLLGVEPVVRMEPKKSVGRRVMLAFAACVMATLMALPLLVKRSSILRETSIVSFKGTSFSSEAESAREFNYPAEYEPPELSGGGVTSFQASSPETPATPSVSPIAKAEGVATGYIKSSDDMLAKNGREMDQEQAADPFADSSNGGGSYGLDGEDLAKNGPVAEVEGSARLSDLSIADSKAKPSEAADLGDIPVLGRLFGGEEKQAGVDGFQTADKPEDGNQWGSKNGNDGSVGHFFGVNQWNDNEVADVELATDFDSSSTSLEVAGRPLIQPMQGGPSKDLTADPSAFAGYLMGGGSAEGLDLYTFDTDVEGQSLGYADSSNGVDHQDMVQSLYSGDSSVSELKPDLGSRGYSSLAQMEMTRRANVVIESDRKRDEAREAYANGRYKEAQQKYEESIEILPAAPLLDDRREFLQKSLADSEVARSEEEKRMGRYEEARELLESAKQRDPGNRYAMDGLASLDDPIRQGSAVTAGNRESLEEIRRDLYEAEGAFELGKFAEAKEKYDEVIRKDPYNTAARRGIERANAATTDYYRAAYDQARAELLMEVDEAWEMAVPPDSSITGKKTELEGEVHVGYENPYEFRFVAPEQSLASKDESREKTSSDLTDESLAAAEERLKGLKKEVGMSAIQAAKIAKVSSASESELAKLRDAVQKQEDLVEDKRKTLTTIIRNQELIHRGLNQSGGREGGLSSDEEARMAALSFAELSEQKVKLDSQIETLMKYDDDQLMTYASGLQLPENVVRELQPQYLESKRDLDVMKLGGLGNDHPSVIRQKKVVEGMKGQIDQSIESLRENLLVQRELATEQSNRLAEQMAEKKGKAVQQGIGLHGFDDAKQEFETSQKLLEQLKIKLAAIEGESVSRQESAKIEIPKPTKDNSATLDAMAEVSAAAEAFSTFSMHVSDASFKLAAAAMERGEMPAAESVRPEEFYNAFDYGDPAPTANEPVACAVEQCAHPAFPQRNLLRIAVRTGAEGRAQSKPLNLTLLLDNSGSMEREDRALGLNRAVEGLTSLLKEGDTVTVAGFSRQPRLLADRVDGKDAASLNGLVVQTPAEGGTNLEEALKLGGDLAKRQFKEGAQNRVVLFTDGAANLGDADPESLNGKVEQLRNEGIAFDAAGFGADGLNDRLLERLTRNGNGRYYVVDDASDADQGFAKQLAGAFRPAAENVKVQVVFNPARVGNYKLIGFEEHRLKKEDFRNDAVDAAEMASEEAGVALYQFEILPEGQGEVGEVSIRFRDTATGEMVEQSWPIPYDPQASSFDQAKPGIQLAGIAAFVAEKLRGAPLAEAVDYSELRGVMARVKAEYEGNERVAQLEQMMRR